MIFLVALAFAQALTWSEARDMALRDGVDIQRATLALSEAEAVTRARQHQWDPALTAGIGATTAIGADGVPTLSASARLTAAASLWTGGAQRARLDGARAGQAVGVADAEAARQATILAVAGALVTVDEARSTVTVQRSLLAAEEATASRVEALVAAGARTRADALSQAAAVAAARSGLVNAERARIQAELDVALLLRLDATRDWTFTGPEAAPTVEGDVLNLRDRALAGRPDLAASRAALEVAEAQAREAAAGRLPRLDAAAGLSSGWEAPGEPAADPYAWAGVDLTVPLLDRGTTRQAVESARLGALGETLGVAALTEEITAQVRGALVARDAARSALDAAEAQREAASAALEVVQDRYDAGAALLVELTAARAAAVQGERAVTTSRADLLRTGFSLAWTVGAL